MWNNNSETSAPILSLWTYQSFQRKENGESRVAALIKGGIIPLKRFPPVSECVCVCSHCRWSQAAPSWAPTGKTSARELWRWAPPTTWSSRNTEAPSSPLCVTHIFQKLCTLAKSSLQLSRCACPQSAPSTLIVCDNLHPGDGLIGRVCWADCPCTQKGWNLSAHPPRSKLTQPFLWEPFMISSYRHCIKLQSC